MKIYQLFCILLLSSCHKDDKSQTKIVPDSKTKNSNKLISKEQIILDLNTEIINVLKNKDHRKLFAYIHPQKGITLSMYSYISEKDKHFSRSEFEKYIKSEIKFTFGQKDGSGADYIVSLEDYIKNWVFKRDFSNAKVNKQSFEGNGNTLNNIKEKYPNAITVENYLAGTVEYSYMDWNSLILIFENIDNQYFLVGIANNQWTV